MEQNVIKNFDALATSSLRRDGLAILEAGFRAVLMPKVVGENIKRNGDHFIINDRQIRLRDYERIFFVAIGKCAVSATAAIEPLILDKLTAGICLDVVPGRFEKVKSLIGTHPLVSEENLSAGKEIVSILSGLTERDLVLCVISGGGSALFEIPTGLSIDQLKALTRLAFAKGATIEDLNIIRRHLSKVKGGGLAKIAYPATIISLLISDVPGNDPISIASGPTVFDESTVNDARAVVEKYQMTEILSWPGFELAETPKDQMYFAGVQNVMLLTNYSGLEAMKHQAEDLGYSAFIKNERLEGEAKDVAFDLAKTSLPAKTCFIYGGETTVILKGAGKGGRCQELALNALLHMGEGRLVIAASSDGWDHTEAAGAMADRDLLLSIPDGQKEVEAHLADNSSFDFFQKHGGQIITGKTGTNVSDFYIYIRN